jgi:hypothetical protein
MSYHGKLTPEQRDSVAFEYRNGASIHGLARKYGIHFVSIKGLIKRRGIPLRIYVAPVKKPSQAKYRANKTPVHDVRCAGKFTNALKRGELVRPDRCSVCQKVGPVHGHHDDYNFPLRVRWLCRSCHYLWHSENIPIPSIDPVLQPRKGRKK